MTLLMVPRALLSRFLRSTALGALAVILIAGEAMPEATAWDALRTAHVDTLVAFVNAGGDNKAGSLELDVRQEAAAFARRIDNKSTKLKNLFARKRAMTVAEAEADRVLRTTVAAQEKRRLETEGKDGNAEFRPDVATAEPQTLPAELETLRHRMLVEQLDFALRISLDPDEQPLVVLRKSILTQIKGVIGPTRWAWERQFKEHVERALAAKYEPWNFTWTCGADGWGELVLSQDGPVVKGRWREGTLTAQVKGRSLEGIWQSTSESGKSDKGTFTFTLSDSDHGFDARVSGGVGIAKHWNALRKDVADKLITTTVTEESEATPEAKPAQ